MRRILVVLTACCCITWFSACPKKSVSPKKTLTSSTHTQDDDDKDDKVQSISSIAPKKSEQPAPREVLLTSARPNLAVALAPTLGPPDAPITITMFSDFACQLCAQLVRPLKQVMRAYRGKVRLVYKNFPEHRSHFIFHQAAMAAHQQGRFWAYHDLLLARQKSLSRTSLLRYAKQLGLKMPAFRVAMKSSFVRAHVEADELQGQRKGLTQIPTFFLNEKQLSTPSGYAFFQTEINKVLRRKGFKKKQLPFGLPPGLFTIRSSPTQGDADAPVTIVTFMDFENPMCVLAAPQLRRLMIAFRGKVRWVYKHFPMRFRGQGLLAAQAAHEAYQQGKFWSYSQMLWTNPKKLQRTDLERYAQAVGMDLKRFRKALDRQTWRKRIQADIAEGKKAGVQGVPLVFLDGYKATGFYYNNLRGQVLAALKRKGIQAKPSVMQGRGLFQTKGSPSLGPVNARVQVVIFSDFTSSFGGTFGLSIQKLARKYQGKVRWVYKHFPEDGNTTAWLAAQASMAAHEQNKFWAYHDVLFANSSKLRRKDLEGYAKNLGLDLKRFRLALQTKRHKALIQRDQKEGKQNGVIGAPTVYVNGQRLPSASLKLLKQRIEQ